MKTQNYSNWVCSPVAAPIETPNYEYCIQYDCVDSAIMINPEIVDILELSVQQLIGEYITSKGSSFTIPLDPNQNGIVSIIQKLKKLHILNLMKVDY